MLRNALAVRAGKRLDLPLPRSRPRRKRRGATPLVVAGTLIGFMLLVLALAGPVMVGDPTDTSRARGFASPSLAAPFGTDKLGRDVLARVVYGTRTSLLIAGTSVAAAGLAGTVFGLIAGYAGGRTDRILGAILDPLFGLPMIPLAIAITAALGPGMFTVILAISIGFFPSYVRVVRAPAMAERSKEYVTAAIVTGAGPVKIAVRHILPNIVPAVIVQGSVLLSHAILTESALGFLGLGVQPPVPSWGQMLNEGRSNLQIAPWVSIFPGLAIFAAVLAFNLLGDGLRDYLDPRLRSRQG